MAGVKRTRSESPELGSQLTPTALVTHRPARRSAGTKSLPAGYVDPNEALRPMFNDESDSDDDSCDSDGRKHRPWTKIKRHLSPGRALSPALPVQDLPLDNQDRSTTTEPTNPQTISLTFHIPRGHSGPFVVNIDIASLLGSSVARQAVQSSHQSQHDSPLHSQESASNLGRGSPRPSGHPSTVGQTGFLNLPPELRNMIYRKVLVTDSSINIRSASNFCRTSAILATCRQIHDESTQILYGENKFELERQWHIRSPYYESSWEEVAYKDCFRFLSTIGPSNVSLIRSLSIVCDDGPSRGQLTERHRFVNDDYLIQCLKLIASHGRLQKLNLAFHGKRMVKFTDHRFVNHLLALKADQVIFLPSRHTHARRWYYPPSYRMNVNVQHELDTMIKEKVERKKKMYEV